MEQITPTEEFESLGASAARGAQAAGSEAPTVVHRPAGNAYRAATGDHGIAGEPSQAPLLAGHDRCVGCGAPLASDQRYCVECGQRLGRARLPFMDDVAAQHRPGGIAEAPRRTRISANTALIAGIGTLMLAMGVGVLIGRSSGQNRSSGPTQFLTVPSAAQSANSAAGSLPASEPQSSSTTPPTGAAKTSSSAGKSGKTTLRTPAKSALPPPKAVKIGSPGKGPGYQKGHFTGNFFGGGEEEE